MYSRGIQEFAASAVRAPTNGEPPAPVLRLQPMEATGRAADIKNRFARSAQLSTTSLTPTGGLREGSGTPTFARRPDPKLANTQLTRTMTSRAALSADESNTAWTKLTRSYSACKGPNWCLTRSLFVLMPEPARQQRRHREFGHFSSRRETTTKLSRSRFNTYHLFGISIVFVK